MQALWRPRWRHCRQVRLKPVRDDTAQDAGFLAFLYPVANAVALKKSIVTIDL
jgi:hypothetical protein